jgi:hypothetical protein
MGTTSTASSPGHDGRPIQELLGRGRDEGLSQFEHAQPLRGHRFHRRHLRRPERIEQGCRRPGEIRFIEHHDGGKLPAAQLIEQPLLEVVPMARIDHDQRQVGAIEDLPRLLHAFFAQGAEVVDARRIDEQHRADGQQLHGLFHRIGRGAGHFRDDRHLLPGQGVQQRRLARIAAAEQPDVQPETLGSGLHERPSISPFSARRWAAV